MTQLDLRDLGTLVDLQVALGRFATETQDALAMARKDIQRTQEWLNERVNHWQRMVGQARQEVARAEADLRRCQASGYRDQQGCYHQPECSRQASLMEHALARLRECEQKLLIARAWRSRIEQASDEYARVEGRLRDLAGNHTERAQAFLKRVAACYAELQTAASIVGGALAVGAVLGLVGTAVKALGTAVGHYYKARGDLFEEPALRLTLDDLGLREVAFDRRAHGFDGLLRGPSGQIIIFESKTNDRGELHLDAKSQQLTVAWVERVAREMTDRNSELWSPDNERIGQEILEQEPERTPVLATVVNPNTDQTDIYLVLDGAAKVKRLLSSGLPVGGEQ